MDRTQLRDRAYVNRIVDDLGVSESVTTGTFMTVIGGPNGRLDENDLPRSGEPRWTLYYAASGLFPPPIDLNSGARLVFPGRTRWPLWEILEQPEPFRRAPLLTDLYSAPVLPFPVLYPKMGIIEELGGSVVKAEVPVGKGRPRSSQETDHGELADTVFDIPVDYFDDLQGPNREIVVDNQHFRMWEIRHMDHWVEVTARGSD